MTSVVVAGPDGKVLGDPREERVARSIDVQPDPSEFRRARSLDVSAEMAAEELMPDADTEHRDLHPVDPTADRPEGVLSALQAQRAPGKDDRVRIELLERGLVRDDATLGAQVPEHPILPVGPLTAIVDDRDLHGRTGGEGSVDSGSEDASSRRRSSVTSSRSLPTSERILNISSSNAVNPLVDCMRWEM